MAQTQKSESGFNSLIYDGNLQDGEQVGSTSSQDTGKETMYNIVSWRQRLPEAGLALLALILLIVDISLGVHYVNLKDTHLTLEDTERISTELLHLQETYKNTINSMYNYEKKTSSETKRQEVTQWEWDHQTKMATNYEEMNQELTKKIDYLRFHLPMSQDGCKHCPPGWIMWNSICYYLPLSKIDGTKTWQRAREFCQNHDGDLAIIDSKEKQNATVRLLLAKQDKTNQQGFWIGLKNSEIKGMWKWVNGNTTADAYWMIGEPSYYGPKTDVCAALFARENFFMAWSTRRCDNERMKWICEKKAAVDS